MELPNAGIDAIIFLDYTQQYYEQFLEYSLPKR